MASLQLPNNGSSHGALSPVTSSPPPLRGFFSAFPHLGRHPLPQHKLLAAPASRPPSSFTFNSLPRSLSSFSARTSFVCTPLVAKSPDSDGQFCSHPPASRLLRCSAGQISAHPPEETTDDAQDGRLCSAGQTSNHPAETTTDIAKDDLHETQSSAAVHSLTKQKLNDCISFTAGILEMSRLQNLLPSMALVFLGSWMAAGRTMSVFLRPSVWITAICSALISAASMLANDIFDYKSGTDAASGKTSPLLRGQVRSDDVELVAGCLYAAVVIGVCYLEPVNLRLLVGGAAIATYIYTPFLKKLTVVKNVLVSGVITSSILAGAMVIGKGQLGNPTIAVALFFFLCVFSREVLMDVHDIVGDQATGVKTLAVRFGGRIGTLTASLGLATANGLLIALLAVKANALAMIGTLSLLPLHASVLQLCFSKRVSELLAADKTLPKVIEQSMISIGLGLLVLASAA